MGIEQKDVRQVNIDVSRVVPVFADEVIVAAKIKAFKKEEGSKQVEKEGNIELIFLDQLTHPPKAISRVVVSRSTAKGLIRVLNDNLQKMEKDLKDKNMPKPNVPQHPIQKQDKGYLG